MARASPTSSRQAWDVDRFASFVFGASLTIEGAITRDPLAFSRGASVVADALAVPSTHVRGLFALAAMDATRFVALLDEIGEATQDQAHKLAKLLTASQPLVATTISSLPRQLARETQSTTATSTNKKFLPYDELCARVDADRSRTLSFDEYRYALHILGLDVSTARTVYGLRARRRKGRWSCDV